MKNWNVDEFTECTWCNGDIKYPKRNILWYLKEIDKKTSQYYNNIHKFIITITNNNLNYLQYRNITDQIYTSRISENNNTIKMGYDDIRRLNRLITQSPNNK